MNKLKNTLISALLVMLMGNSYASSNPASTSYVNQRVQDLKKELINLINKISSGTIGPQGPAGEEGKTGPQGPAGAAGPAGADGATGPQGPAGADGATGPQGPTGADGATGPQGPTGADGAIGPQGPAGPNGATGANGATGPQGPAGANGAIGPQGPAGVNGAAGPQGPAGATGPQGPAGTYTAGLGIDISGDTISTIEASTVYSIGDKALGGTVIYTNNAGNHGLVAANSDQAVAITWWVAEDTISDPKNFDEAGKEFTDWQLPTKYELNLLYQYRDIIGQFDKAIYWCSTENSSSDAWNQNFTTSVQDRNDKNESFNVRAIRYF
ncbi:MAG: DUF1566 domain-containing protein [Tatlockia sp.]|nr:DUF1566 domain-containing protein [Tatlockia sp.]